MSRTAVLIPGFDFTLKTALEIVVSLAKPGKMPCYGYSIPADMCKKGSKLVDVEGSICSDCYALRGWYPKRRDIFYKRFLAIQHPQWINAMAFLIHYYNCAYFRWHDSGDLQSVEHFGKICMVAELTPDTKHWLPTREYEMVVEYAEQGNIIPKNLKVMFSATMLDGRPPYELAKKVGAATSTVVTDGSENCPAHLKTYITDNGKKKEWKGYCGSCRECWEDGADIKYHFHGDTRGRPRSK